MKDNDIKDKALSTETERVDEADGTVTAIAARRRKYE